MTLCGQPGRESDDMEKLELTIDPEYANWGLWEAMRELIQNYLDALDETGQSFIEYSPMAQSLVMRNDGVTMDRRALILGNTQKRDDDSSRGQWGEGMKIAWATLIRLGCDVVMTTGAERWIPKIVSSSAFDGAELLEVSAFKMLVLSDDISVEVYGIRVEDWEMISSRVLPLAALGDGESIPGNGGRLLTSERFVGKLFVKGIYVCDMPGKWKWGYDLDNVELDRDRKVPSGMSLGPAICGLLKDLTLEGGVASETILDMLADDDSQEGELFADWWNDREAGEFHKRVAEVFKAKLGETAVPVSNDQDALKAENHGMKAVIVPKALRVVVEKSEGALAERIESQPPSTVRDPSGSQLSDWERKALALAFKLISAAVEYLTEEDIRIVNFRNPHELGDYRGGKIMVARRLLEDYGMLVVVLAHEAACHDAREGTVAHRNAKDKIIAHALETLTAENMQ